MAWWEFPMSGSNVADGLDFHHELEPTETRDLDCRSAALDGLLFGVADPGTVGAACHEVRVPHDVVYRAA